MEHQFIERRDTGFYLTRSRVPLDCIVHEYRTGESPEAIRSHFPTLSLEQVYGAITFYLGHTAEVDAAMAAREAVEDAFQDAHPAPEPLKRKLEQVR